MMNENFIGLTIALVILVFAFAFFLLFAGDRLTKYEDTIAEYVICIKYNTDGDCSDIILSEYGEEAK